VVVDDFDAIRVTLLPFEADSPLIIDPNAILSLAITVQPLQLVSWRAAQVIKRFRCIQQQKFSQGRTVYVAEDLPGESSIEDLLAFPATKALDHGTL
jgi:hypothetical protein